MFIYSNLLVCMCAQIANVVSGKNFNVQSK